MAIEKRKIEEILVLDIHNDLDVENAQAVRSAIEDSIRSQKYEVIINLADVPLVTSRGIGTLITSQTKLKKYGGDMRICNVSEQNMSVFKVTKLNTIFQIFSSEEEAINSYK